MNSILGADRCRFFCNAAACVLTAMNGFSGFGFGNKSAATRMLTAVNGFSGITLVPAPCKLTGVDGFSGVGCFTTPCVLTDLFGFWPKMRTASRELAQISLGLVSEENEYSIIL